MRNNKLRITLSLLSILIIFNTGIVMDVAQAKEIKAIPPMYSYIAVWNIPEDQWEAREDQADAVDQLSKNFFGPVLEKMLADGTIFEWETDTYADPRDSPGTFLIAYLSEKAEDLEKANKAVQERLKSRLPNGPALDSLVDMNEITDVVVRSYAVYKK